MLANVGEFVLPIYTYNVIAFFTDLATVAVIVAYKWGPYENGNGNVKK